MKTKPIILIPKESCIEIHPNNVGYRQERVEDDCVEDGFYFKTIEYILDKPNLIINATIKCGNNFKTNNSYMSESEILWIAINEDTIRNQSQFIDKFIFEGDTGTFQNMKLEEYLLWLRQEHIINLRLMLKKQ